MNPSIIKNRRPPIQSESRKTRTAAAATKLNDKLGHRVSTLKPDENAVDCGHRDGAGALATAPSRRWPPALADAVCKIYFHCLLFQDVAAITRPTTCSRKGTTGRPGKQHSSRQLPRKKIKYKFTTTTTKKMVNCF